VALREEFAPFFVWPATSPNPPTVGDTLFEEMAADGWRGAERWRLAADGIAPTIVGGSKKHGGADLGPTRAKRAWLDLHVDAMGLADARPNAKTPVNHFPRLTSEMVALIQGWRPQDGWHFTGRKTARYRQIGNAFPPPVARAVGTSIFNSLQKTGEARTDLRRADLTDAAVYRVLASAGNEYLSVSALAEETGQHEEKVSVALSHLDIDFVLERRVVRGEKRFRLAEFRGLAPESLQSAAK
jgi:DNA (cytosine-5)-methyltransferase 1